MKAVLFCTLLVSGCASAVIRPRPALVFDDGSPAPLSWRADIGSAPREVLGESCRYAVGLPLFLYGGFDLIGWAQDGYREAVADAQAKAPGRTLSDVRADIRFLNVFVFRKECLEVTAAVR